MKRSQHNARRAHRQPARKSTRITVIFAGRELPPTDARLLDLSARGVRLTCSVPMRPGDQFLIPLDGRGVHRRRLLYQVVRSHYNAASQIEIGAEFVCVVASDGSPLGRSAIARARRAILG